MAEPERRVPRAQMPKLSPFERKVNAVAGIALQHPGKGADAFLAHLGTRSKAYRKLKIDHPDPEERIGFLTSPGSGDFLRADAERINAWLKGVKSRRRVTAKDLARIWAGEV